MHGRALLRYHGFGDVDMTSTVVGGIDEFDEALEKVSARAELEGALQVDIQDVPLRPGGPVLIQVLVGPGSRSSLLWHEDGVGFAAVDHRLSPLTAELSYTSGSDRRSAPPEETRIAAHTAIEALVVYLLTGERVASLGWVEIAAD